jgi:hypothetical protein
MYDLDESRVMELAVIEITPNFGLFTSEAKALLSPLEMR